MRVLHARQGRDAVVLAGVQNVLVDFVGHHVHIGMAAYHVGDGFQLLPRQGRTAGILRRVDDEQPCVLVDQFGQFA